MILKQGSQEKYILCISTGRYDMIGEGVYPLIALGDVTRCVSTITSLDTEWALGEPQDMTDSKWSTAFVPIWSNFDILNADDSVHLATSDPIPLDGMNVIEWDGDTTGLEKFGTINIYCVSSATNVDVGRNVCAIRTNVEGRVTSILNATLLDKGDYYANVAARYVAEASEVYPYVGIYLANNGLGTACTLFAYYPINEEPKPISYIEYLVNPKYRMGNPFRGFFGWLWQRK
jgi:hypothetical protein